MGEVDERRWQVQRSARSRLVAQMREALRFFRVVPPVPRLMVMTFAVVTIASVVAITVDPRYARGTLNGVIVLQLFAASSGFAGAARRGHYDLLLTRGERRAVIAAAHWLLSVTPGLASWFIVASAEGIAIRSFGGVGFSSGTSAAIAAVSAIGWAATTPLPRFAGAIGWIVVLIMADALVPSADMPHPLVNVVYPLGLVGGSLRAEAVAVIPVLLVGAGSMVTALVWIERTDVPLEAAQ